MSDLTDQLEAEMEGNIDCPYHQGMVSNLDKGIPCTACEDGDPPTKRKSNEHRQTDADLRGQTNPGAATHA